ncbi:MAG: hypothetical protein ABL308_06605 [Oceanicaulis sp.]
MSENTESKPDAEPVDAEFEPAPSGEEAPASDDTSRAGGGSGGGALRAIGLVIASAAIGGLVGYAASRYLPGEPLPGPSVQGLEDRIAALESDQGEGADMSALTGRIDALEDQLAARADLPARVDTLAADLAGLREQIAGFESAPSGEGQADIGAIAALEDRLAQAFGQIEDRLTALEEDVQTARSEAETARSAVSSVQAALADAPAGEGGADPARLAALAGTVNDLQGRVDALAEAVSALEGLPARVQALSDQPGAAPDLDPLRARIATLEERVAALFAAYESQPPRPARPAPQGEPADLASRALAFAALSEAASGTEPFAVEVEAMRRVWPNAPGLDALSRHARQGAPTLDRLEESFPARPLREATGETRTFFGVLSVDRQGEDGPAARIAAALDAGDLSAAADIVSGLDGDAADAVADWADGLTARLAVKQALDAQSAALAGEGGSR